MIWPVNFVLIPIYICAFGLSFFVTFLPIFPSRVGLQNLQSRLGANWMKRHWILSCVFFNYFCYFLEITLFQFFGWNRCVNEAEFAKFMCSFRPEDRLSFLGAHLGNTEATASAIARWFDAERKGEFYALAKPAKIGWLTQLETQIRVNHKLKIIYNNRVDLIKTMMIALKAGHGLGLIVDQKPQSGGPFFSFFGEHAAFPTGGVEVSKRVQSEFVFIACRRIVPGRFELKFYKLNAQNPLPEYVSQLEQLVSLYPSQWCWDYKKWSRKPSSPSGTLIL